MIFMLENNVIETKSLNLSKIWNFSENYANSDILKFSQRKNNFINNMDETIAGFLGHDVKKFNIILEKQRIKIKERGEVEINYWDEEIENIRKYSREKAINELIKTKKINEKISRIESYVRGL